MNCLCMYLERSVAAAALALVVAGITGCVPGAPISTEGDGNVAKITIVAKRMTEVDKRAYDAQTSSEQVTLLRR